MKKVIFSLIIILVITSCEKTISVGIPAAQPKLFIDGITESGDIFKVKVGKAAGILTVTDSNTYKVNDALVQLFVNNVITDTLIYNSLSYNYIAKNKTVPITGNTYLIKAAAPGYVTAEAETTTPAVTLIQNITRKVNARKDAMGNDMDEIKITFQDNGEQPNYYLFKIKSPTYSFDTTEIYNAFPCLYSGDADIDRRAVTDPTSIDHCIFSEFFMTDKNFNGRLKEITLFAQNNYFTPYLNTNNNKLYRAIIELYSITDTYYKYRKSYDTYFDNNDNPFSEPVLVYSNVKNGYGLFSSVHVARDTIR